MGALDDSGTVARLAEGDLGDNVAVVDNLTTAMAGSGLDVGVPAGLVGAAKARRFYGRAGRVAVDGCGSRALPDASLAALLAVHDAANGIGFLLGGFCLPLATACADDGRQCTPRSCGRHVCLCYLCWPTVVSMGWLVVQGATDGGAVRLNKAIVPHQMPLQDSVSGASDLMSSLWL